MHVASIELENIRTFQQRQSIALTPGLNVLVGRNNAGKTTCLLAPLWAGRNHYDVQAAMRKDALQVFAGVDIAVTEDDLTRLFALSSAIELGQPANQLLRDHPGFAQRKWALRIGW